MRTVKHTEYTEIQSVYPFPEQAYLLDPPREPKMGFLGWLGAAVLFGVIMLATTCVMAQSNVRQFYGWGDYGANGYGPYRGPQSAYPTPREHEYPRFNEPLPVPVQPRSWVTCRREVLEYNMRTNEKDWVVCYYRGQALRYCRPSATECYENELWDPKTYVMTGK